MSLLEERGYRNVRYYRGGLEDWKAHGAALEAGEPSVPAAPATIARRAPGSGWLLDAIERRSGRQILALWIGLIAVSSLVYWLACHWAGHGLASAGRPVAADGWGVLTALYFSFVTATSVGYGDVVPLGAVRALAIAEAIAGLLIFGVVVSKLVSRRQEQLMEEIHRLTFEDRLERVQANLHLVLSDLHGMADALERGPGSPARIAARMESVAMVFAGELRTIHDLLYRPQQTPEEPVLESILAALAAAFREMAELLRRLDAERPRTAALRSSVGGITRLGEEICGECVPGAYAPKLRQWMDAIRETARKIA